MSAERWSKIRATKVLTGATSASQKGFMMALRAGASYFGVSSLMNVAEKVAGGLKAASEDVLVLPFALLYVGIVMRALPLRFVFDCNDSWARSIGWHALLVGIYLLPDQVNVKFELEATCSLIGLLILGAYMNPNYMRELFGWVSFVLFSSPFLWFLLSTR